MHFWKGGGLMGRCIVARRGGGGKQVLTLEDVTFERRQTAMQINPDGGANWPLYTTFLLLPAGVTWGDIEGVEIFYEANGYRAIFLDYSRRLRLIFDFSSNASDIRVLPNPKGSDGEFAVSIVNEMEIPNWNSYVKVIIVLK